MEYYSIFKVTPLMLPVIGGVCIDSGIESVWSVSVFKVTPLVLPIIGTFEQIQVFNLCIVPHCLYAH